MPRQVIAPGDCVSSLAADHGLLPQTIWDHPKNAALRQRRGDPNVLFPGDVIFIPERSLKEEAKPTEHRHTFVRRCVPSRFRLRLLRNGKPRAHKEYTLEVDGRLVKGKTDSDGWVIQAIPPSAKTGLLRLTDSDERIPVFLGHLDPIDEVAGVQQRLRNLGIYKGPVTGEFDDDTARALAYFQDQRHLVLSGYLDDVTKRALRAAHGS